MIDEFTESDARVIVVKPNKSSTWRANLYVLIAISTSGTPAHQTRRASMELYIEFLELHT